MRRQRQRCIRDRSTQSTWGVAERGLGSDLKFLDGQSFTGLFCISKELRRGLAKESRVLSEKDHAMYSSALKGVCNVGGSV
eukprot:NODE_10279_length_341_cov_12.993151_g9368_i0.p1 GENE.NODE_10279_length_341_cov_12.993151_g9368_i0~~NODE_10279_length_341_cov_12.993151_g9368_i0.p1  ORF type:complete len:81 (+),score=23.48 NODE_10279_length_341_cov_12.993151_g9368_i0:36-278(+)